MAKPADKHLISLDPGTGMALGFVGVTDVEDIPHRVQAARDVQPGWAALGVAQRARMMQEAATALLANAPRLGALLSEETGKPRQCGLREIQSTAQGITANIRNAFSALRVRSKEDAGGTTSLYRDPLGTCAVITPWDNPVATSLGFMIPALMAGNTVILKPSPNTPLIAQQLVEIYQRYLPKNVLQIVQGADAQGRALVASNVQLIALCGSSSTGKHVMASAAYGLKPMLLALGAKNTAIVLAGADLDVAARYIIESSLGDCPRCLAIERVFIDLRIAAELEPRLTDLARRYRIGTWNDPDADTGPMINNRRREKTARLIANAINQGAVALTGGANHPDFFIRPTLLSQVVDDMDIAHEEILAPVLCISYFSQKQQAITAINRSRYGQRAVVFGKADDAIEVGRQLDAAELGINKGISGDELPRVGAKHSGLGEEPMLDAYHQFTQSRIVHH